MKRFIFFTIFFIFALSLTVCASTRLSPALDIIANDYSMVKASVVNNGEFVFDVDDFDNSLGINVQAITITSLPSASVGKLMLENLYVVEKQVISREDFSLLKFVKTTKDDVCPIFKANALSK